MLAWLPWLPWLLAAGLTQAEAPPTQLLVVTTPGWKAPRGVAVLIEEGRVVYGPVPVWVGHTGLGWGTGEHPHPRLRGPRKREGDGRSPAGIFRLGPTWRSAWARRTFCVDDSRSPDYARIVTLEKGAKARWSSAEPMAAYRKAVVVVHNPGRRPRAGSCIFLHDGEEPTVGCTAFRERDLDAIARRLRWGTRLVQLPTPIYTKLWRRWRLPEPRRLGGASK